MLLALSLMVTSWFVVVQSSSDPQYYTAAVYEHVRVGDIEKEPLTKILQDNLLAYGNVTSIAAEKGADIIVLPEFGLYPLTPRESVKTVAEYIPDPKIERWNPCLNPANNENITTLTRLSCMAKDNNIFVVANMITMQPCAGDATGCRSDKIYLFNTNVVFDRNGTIIAHYHKYHLFYEPAIDTPPNPEFVVFDTDFGRFGTFVCFDILWKESTELVQKYKVDTIAFSALWFDERPKYTSIQTMWSWALGTNVNLLGTNLQRPSSGNVGTGIFIPSLGIANYVYDPNGKSKLLLSQVPRPGVPHFQTSSQPVSSVIEFENHFNQKDNNNNLTSGVCSKKILGPPKDDLDYRCHELSLLNYTLVKLVSNEDTLEACNNGFCCRVNYKATLNDEDYYLAVVNSSLYIHDHYDMEEEVCMVVRCDSFDGKICSTFPTKSTTVFSELNMRANFTTEYVYPSVVMTGIELLPTRNWSYANNTLSLQADDELLFAVMNGRCYDRESQ